MKTYLVHTNNYRFIAVLEKSKTLAYAAAKNAGHNVKKIVTISNVHISHLRVENNGTIDAIIA